MCEPQCRLRLHPHKGPRKALAGQQWGQGHSRSSLGISSQGCPGWGWSLELRTGCCHHRQLGVHLRSGRRSASIRPWMGPAPFPFTSCLMTKQTPDCC